MLASLPSTELESETTRFGNPDSFKKQHALADQSIYFEEIFQSLQAMATALLLMIRNVLAKPQIEESILLMIFTAVISLKL